jgi:hypothetical protein
MTLTPGLFSFGASAWSVREREEAAALALRARGERGRVDAGRLGLDVILVIWRVNASAVGVTSVWTCCQLVNDMSEDAAQWRVVSGERAKSRGCGGSEVLGGSSVSK